MQIFDIIDSTQIEAKRQIDVKNNIANDAILAITQTNGISTKKDVPWITQKGDLNLSVILNIPELLKNGNICLEYLPFAGSMAILSEILTLREKTNGDFHPFLKWPNDVLILSNGEYKKVCGILCDNYKGHFIIGIGCNLISHPLITQHFKATDLFVESKEKLDCIEFAESVISSLMMNIKQIQTFGFHGIKERWKKYAYMLGKTLILRDGGEVIFNDISDDGCILASDKFGKHISICKSDEVIGGKW